MVTDEAYGAEIMGNKETLFFTRNGNVLKLYYNTPAPEYPKLVSDDFPGFRGIARGHGGFEVREREFGWSLGPYATIGLGPPILGGLWDNR